MEQRNDEVKPTHPARASMQMILDIRIIRDGRGHSQENTYVAMSKIKVA